MITRATFGMMALALTTAIVPACGDEPPKVTTENDVVYTRAGDTDLKIDLARPAEGDGPFPAVLVIHGGGWRAGDKSGHRGLIRQSCGGGKIR